jgi:uncharacterized protein YpbB
MIKFENNTEIQLAKKLIFETNESLFLTGNAGTGKSTFLKEVISHCPKNKIVLAPTGVASINVKGTTIHSFFNLPFTPFNPTENWSDSDEEIGLRQLLSKLRYNTEKRALIKELDLMIIDEISMVRADVIDAIDFILRHFRDNRHEAFGGVQVLFVGDLYQLPPVANGSTWDILGRFYRSPFFYDSKVIEMKGIHTIELKKIYRQSDSKFINILNAIRNNRLTETERNELNQRKVTPPENADDLIITLTTHRAIADEINERELRKLEGEIHVYHADISGDFRENSYPIEPMMELKEGSQILFVKNDISFPRKYFNGKIGVVSRLTKDAIYVKSKNEAQEWEEIQVHKDTWTQYEYNFNIEKNRVEEKEVGTFQHYPIKLAWAITIHKSQGLTFDKVKLDIRDSFVSGQTYVALSRCTSLEGIYLLNEYPSKQLNYPSHLIAFSKNSIENQRLEQTILEKKDTYLRNVLMRILNLKAVTETLKEILDLFEEAKDKVKGSDEILAQIKQIQTKWQDIAVVNQKFLGQLHQIFTITDMNERQAMLDERVGKAVIYFGNQLIEDVLKPVLEIEYKIKLFFRIAPLKKELEMKIALLKMPLTKFERLKQYGVCEHVSFDELTHKIKDLETVLPVEKPKIKQATTEISLELLQEGMTISQIAEARNLTTGTIYGHFFKLYEEDRLELKAIFNEEELIQIKNAVKSLPAEADYAYIKEHLEDIDYNIIRFWRKNQEKIEKNL